MIRSMPFLLCLILAGCVKAQPAPQPDPKKDETKKEEPKKEPVADEPGPETKADLTAFVKKQFPDIDPAGEHDYTKIKNYPPGKKRFDYTRAMTRLVSFYIDSCGQGSIVAKRFDAWANTELANQATFNLLHAVVCMQYPDGRPNLTAAHELINKALQLDPKFEYAHYVRARLQYAAFESGQGSRVDVEKSLEAALNWWPDFPEAIQLKARLLLVAKPPESAAAKALLEKCFEYAPDDPTVFQDLLGLYAEAATVAALADKLELAINGKKFSKRYEAEARAFLGYAFSREGNYDAAVKSFDMALAMVKPADDPAATVRWHVNVAGTWARMAKDLRDKKPKLEGQDKKLFDGYVKTARDHVALAAEIERTQMPIDMRGPAAAAYIEFLGAQIGEFQAVINWLAGYLENTDLRASVRTSLERLLNDLRSRVTGDEGAALKNLKLARDSDVNQLIAELSRQVDNVRTGKFHFKLAESLKLFQDLMSHQNASVAQLVAFLLVDSALQSTKPEDIEAAANAIASRLEQETELTTEARAQFQGQLLSALLIFDKRVIDLRAAKALRKIVASTQEINKTETELISEAREVIELLNNDEWKARVWGKDADNHSLRSSKQRKFDDLLKWLDEAIAQLETLTKDKEEKKEEGK